MKFSKHARSYGLEIIYQQVAELEPGLDFHNVKLANGNILQAHAVILATGGSPRKLEVTGDPASGDFDYSVTGLNILRPIPGDEPVASRVFSEVPLLKFRPALTVVSTQ